MTNSYYVCIYIAFYFTRVLNFTRVYTRDLMPHIFFAFAHVCHTRGLFKLWVICAVFIVAIAIYNKFYTQYR